jgi:choline dehydrogenase-like flavoprotein
MKLIGMDVGSTTVKAVVVEDGRVTWQDYQRHNTRQAEKVFEFLARMEREGGIAAGRDRIFFTGSGAGFLAPLAGSPRLTVLTGACGPRLLFEGTRCVGVEIARDGALEEIRAEREVVVCAGTVESPKLLLLSGIGAADELGRLGIDVVADLPGVGRNLHDHAAALAIRTVFVDRIAETFSRSSLSPTRKRN